MEKDKRIRIITGHYGSGKTEFSMNYAMELAKLKKKVALVDLDVVNLYFRSREKEELLQEHNIRMISSSIRGNTVDIPSISADILAPLDDESYDVILDLGGDPAGARALARYKKYFSPGSYDMFFILNANRADTQTVDKAMEYMIQIQDTAGLEVTGIINNTHLLKSTTIEDVIKGNKVALELCAKTNIPFKYNVVTRNIVKNLPKDLEGEVFPIDLYMRDEWMI